MSSTVKNFMGGVGAVASILITGLLSTDTLSCTTPSSTTIYPTWNGTGWLFSNLKAYGNYVVTATRGSKTKTETVYVDTAEQFTIPMAFSRLPSEFQEVVYIESNRSATSEYSSCSYINTMITAKYNATKIDITHFKVISYSHEWATYFGVCDTDGGSTTFWLRRNHDYNSGNAICTGIGTQPSSNYYTNWVYPYTLGSVLSNIVFDRTSGLYVNGSQATRTGSDGSATNSSNPMYIFAVNRGNKDWRGTPCQFGEVKIYEGTTLVGDFIPCYCTTTVTGYKGATSVSCSSGTIGMYDLVTNKFHINSGTSTFTKGDDV